MDKDQELRGWKAHCVYLQDRCERLELENSRLQAAIDAANAQSPWFYKEIGALTIMDASRYRKLIDEGSVFADDYEPVYKSPIPAQQSIWEAHMAGQADAGVDPSYSNAHAYAIAYAISAQQSQSVATPEDVPADCLSPTVSRSRRYGDAESLINEAKNG